MSCIHTGSAAPCTQHRADRHTLSHPVRHALGRFARKLATWFTRYQTRRVLRELDAHMLKDVGLTREQAAREAAKPFWIE